MKFIVESEGTDWLYMTLHMFKSGHASPNDIKDKLVYNVKENGIITLKFDNDSEYLKLFDVTSDDLWFMNNLFSHYSNFYSNFELFDSYRAKEDWNGGYLLAYFNQENMELLENIKNIIAPNIDIDEQKDLISEKLLDFFPKQTESLINDFGNLMDSALTEKIEKKIKDEFCDIFSEDGIHTVTGCFYKYQTTVNNLIKLYDEYGGKSSDLYTLLKKVGHSKSIEGGYYELMWDYYYDVDFDYNSFNRYVSNELNNIMGEMEDSEKFINIEEYKEINEYLVKNFKFNSWYSTPKNKNILFKIRRIEPESNEIEFEYYQTTDGKPNFKQGSLDLEHFNLFLHQPELFSFDS